MDWVVEIIRAMNDHSGSIYAAMDQDALAVLIRNEWASGQWTLLTDDHDRFLGWLSYYRVDEVSLSLIKEHGFEGCIRRQCLLTPGEHLYLANVVVSQTAPACTFRALYHQTVSSIPHKSLSAWLTNRGYRYPRWYHKEHKDTSL